MCLLAEPSLAQHALQRTLTVDPSGNADFTTIQAAIDSPRIGSDPSTRFTVLIYPGTYGESLTLDGTKENVDLVGVDRDAVVIAPPSGNGLTITSGTEAARHNTIGNLTIRTTDGHGIEIRKGTGPGDQTPAEIVIEDCTIEADGVGRHGISGQTSKGVSVYRADISASQSFGITTGSDWLISNSAFNSPAESPTPVDNVAIASQVRVRIEYCLFNSGNVCVSISGSASDITITDSTLHGVGSGPFSGVIALLGGSDITIRHSTITARGSNTVAQAPIGVFQDLAGPQNVELVGCTIEAIGGAASTSVSAYRIDAGSGTRIIDCILRAGYAEAPPVNAPASAFALRPTVGGLVVSLHGCTLDANGGHERETLVYDIGEPSQATPAGVVQVSECSFSRWNIPISTNGPVEDSVQRIIALTLADPKAILDNEALGPQPVRKTGTGQPDTFRVLSATGSAAGMSQDVFIIGHDFAGRPITDKITLAGNATVSGTKAFQSVDAVILPAGNPGEAVSIGYTNQFGLFTPIDDVADVIELSSRTNNEAVYQILPTVGIIDMMRSLLSPPPGVMSGSSLRIVVRGPR